MNELVKVDNTNKSLKYDEKYLLNEKFSKYNDLYDLRKKLSRKFATIDKNLRWNKYSKNTTIKKTEEGQVHLQKIVILTEEIDKVEEEIKKINGGTIYNTRFTKVNWVK